MPIPIFQKFRRSRPPLNYSVPHGVCVYAIGDVHGCLDPLNRLLDVIDKDLRAHDLQSQVVFLGDLVDRGPQSAQVIDRVRNTPLPADRIHFIMGNHEEVMLKCHTGDIESYAAWLQYGGLETLQSYGLEAEDILAEGFDVGAALHSAVPAAHIRFLKKLKDSVRIGDCLFVHAGIRPGVPLEKQATRDLRWIRKDFLADRTDHGCMVIHGHTIVPRVQFHANRIAVDTGCYLTGRLSAVRLETSAASVIATE